MTAFGVSAIVSNEHKLDMVHVQNSTLAGGVAVGSVCNLLIGPHGALLIGFISAVVSVFGYRYLSVRMREKCSLFPIYYCFPITSECSALQQCVCVSIKCLSHSWLAYLWKLKRDYFSFSSECDGRKTEKR